MKNFSKVAPFPTPEDDGKTRILIIACDTMEHIEDVRKKLSSVFLSICSEKEIIIDVCCIHQVEEAKVV